MTTLSELKVGDSVIVVRSPSRSYRALIVGETKTLWRVGDNLDYRKFEKRTGVERGGEVKLEPFIQSRWGEIQRHEKRGRMIDLLARRYHWENQTDEKLEAAVRLLGFDSEKI
jgi:hypothetical protein